MGRKQGMLQRDLMAERDLTQYYMNKGVDLAHVITLVLSSSPKGLK